ncbi:MAG: RNA 2',3'-cyclic phosphodiesterase [Candidatus Binatia bacterium]
MAEDTRVRSFVAVDVASPMRAELQALQARLAALPAEVRWVRPQGLHATVKFLGAVEKLRLEQVRTALVAAVSHQPSLQLRVRGLSVFPSFRRPRVLWVGLQGKGLAELARSVDEALRPLGFAPERRPFTPHITLGRVRGMRGWPSLEAVVKTHLEEEFGESRVDCLTVYRSTLQPTGALYTPLWTIALGRHKGGTSHGSGR